MRINNCTVKSIYDNVLVLSVEAESKKVINLINLRIVTKKVFSLTTPAEVYQKDNVNKIMFLIPVTNTLNVNAQVLIDMDNAFKQLGIIAEEMTSRIERVAAIGKDLSYVQTESKPSSEKETSN